MGKCLSDIRTCASRCTTDRDCDRLKTLGTEFLCGVSEGEGRCISPAAALYQGTCRTTADCAGGMECISLYGEFLKLCLPPCGQTRTCGLRNGFPQYCLVVPGVSDGHCLIGAFSIPCEEDSHCIKTLRCRTRPDAAYKICTAPCWTTADCENNGFVGDNGECKLGPEGGLCVPKENGDGGT
jgi:hypothetical protein